MLPRLAPDAAPATEQRLARARHVLMVLPAGMDPFSARIPFAESLQRTLVRRRGKLADLGRDAMTSETTTGTLVSWVMLDDTRPVFEQHTLLRKGLAALLAERPEELTLAIYGTPAQRAPAACRAAYVALVNGVALPSHKSRDKPKGLVRVVLHGYDDRADLARVRAVAQGNALTRSLTQLPPNELTPALYRRQIRALARSQGWKVEEFDFERLRRMGAGAFCAVAQGSLARDAAVVHLTYAPRATKQTVALVGKGICFDTGGHNLKPARHMHGMHKDMNGSAVVLGILQAATQLRLPLRIDAWLAIAQNHISPAAYKQNDVVTALNGTTIEVVHTDAEGRMVLADTLTLAARQKPDWMLDFATLTGSMKVALGNRYSGVLSNSTQLLDAAIAAGQATGERVCAFPIDADYEVALESKVADIKQCTLEGEADHILAARFLMRFTGDRPWLHMDLSADDCEGGLGAVASEITGFGVAWGVEMLSRL
ncbi:M17 family metallopeptidase [Thiobacter aerophilum]|uniref:Leucyl aminopeptidase family protein n=1 Tax=Thiobacter aerophilum TaxID=3121275 RepID=A0ABV0EBZ2_9BURK